MNKISENAQTPQPLIQQPTYDRIDLHKREAAVVTPFAIAIITGMLTSILVGLLSWTFGAGFTLIIKATAITAAVIWLVVWIALILRWVDLTKLEYWLGDLNGDGIRGEPRQIIFRVNRFDDDKHMSQMDYYFDMSMISDAQIQRFFTTVETSTRPGKQISRRQWTPKNVNGFSEQEWDYFFGELVHQKLLMIQSGKHVLNKDGEEIADGWYERTQKAASPLAEDVDFDESKGDISQ